MPSVGATIAKVPEKDSTGYVTHYFDREVSQMLAHITKKLGKLLGKYVSLSINNISNLIPEFMYYIRWAEYIEKLREGGLKFCKAEVLYQQDEKPDNSEKNTAIPDTGSKEPSHYQADISNQNVVSQDSGSKEPSPWGEGGSRSEPDEGVENAGIKMRARGIYNLKLAAAFLEEKFEIFLEFML